MKKQKNVVNGFLLIMQKIVDIDQAYPR